MFLNYFLRINKGSGHGDTFPKNTYIVAPSIRESWKQKSIFQAVNFHALSPPSDSHRSYSPIIYNY